MRFIDSLSIADTVREGEQYTFIVYTRGDSSKFYQRFLAGGFKHCFVVHFDGQMWYRIEKLFGYMEVVPIYRLSGFYVGLFNVKPYFEAMGHITQEVVINRSKPDNIRVKQVIVGNTCVEVIKDFIGLSSWWTFTPYQLFKKLERLKWDVAAAAVQIRKQND